MGNTEFNELAAILALQTRPYLWVPWSDPYEETKTISEWERLKIRYEEFANVAKAPDNIAVETRKLRTRYFKEEIRKVRYDAARNPKYPFKTFKYFEKLSFLKGANRKKSNDKWDELTTKIRALPDDKKETLYVFMETAYKLCQPAERSEETNRAVMLDDHNEGPSTPGAGRIQQPSGAVNNGEEADGAVMLNEDNEEPSTPDGGGRQQPSGIVDNAQAQDTLHQTSETVGTARPTPNTVPSQTMAINNNNANINVHIALT